MAVHWRNICPLGFRKVNISPGFVKQGNPNNDYDTLCSTFLPLKLIKRKLIKEKIETVY